MSDLAFCSSTETQRVISEGARLVIAEGAESRKDLIYIKVTLQSKECDSRKHFIRHFTLIRIALGLL